MPNRVVHIRGSTGRRLAGVVSLLVVIGILFLTAAPPPTQALPAVVTPPAGRAEATEAGKGPGTGIESISGSYVTFNPALGGDSCYQPAITQTFCFEAHAYTTDNDWPTVLTLNLPSGWTALNATDAGPDECTGGGTISPSFAWWPYSSPNEVIISQTWNLAPSDHCRTTYCVEAVTIDVGPQADVPWYWYVDNPVGNSPHYVCSSDGYTPWLAPPCEESIAPLAAISSCTIEADLGIQKSVVKDEICLGSYGSYELEVTNSGPFDAQGVVVTDNLPLDLVFGGGSPECRATGQTVECDLATLLAGDSHTFLVGFNMAPGVLDGTWITNTAAVGSSTTDPNAANDISAAAGFTATQCFLLPTTLAVEKTMSPDPVNAGEPMTVAITVTNMGPYAAEGVFMQDLLAFAEPIGNLVLPSGWSCDGSMTCLRQDPMPVGAVEAVSFQLLVAPDRAPGTYQNIATVGADNPGAGASATYDYTVEGSADLAIEKHALAADLTAGGEPALFSIVVTNDGPSDAYNVPVVDAPDDGLELLNLTPGTAVSMTCSAGSCTIPVLPRGMAAEVLALVGAPANTAAGTYTNTACIGDLPGLVFSPGPGTGAPPPDLGPYTMTAFPPDGRPLVNVTNISGPTGDLLFDRAVGHRRVGAGWSTWSHGYTGDVYYSNGATTLVMTLPPDTGAFYFYVEPNPFDWITIQATAQDGTTSGPISVHGSYGAHYFGFYSLGGAPLTSITIVGGADFAVGEFGIAEAVMAGGGCSSAAVQVTAEADLAIETTGPLTVTAGDLLTYTVTVHNVGPSDALNVVVTDTLPHGVLPVVGHPLIFDLGALAAGETVTREVVAQADPATCYEGQADNHVEVAADTPDPNPSNNDDAWGTLLLSQSDLALTKVATPVAVAGEAITYTITVRNNGPLAAGNVVVTDMLPAGVTLVATSGCDEDPNGAPACSLGYLAPREVVSYTIVVTSDSNLEPGAGLENQASVRSDTPDCNLANNSDDADTSILANTDLLLTKTGPDTVLAGEFITYTIVVTNLGPSAVPLLDVEDSLPDGVSFYDADVVRSGAGPMGLCAYAACRVPDVQVDELVTVTLVGIVDAATPDGTTLVNEAMAFADSDPTPDAYDTHETAVSAAADLSIEKSVLQDEICLGSGGLYELVVHNDGPSTATAITVTDVLSDALVYGGGSPECTHDGSAVGGTVTCVLPRLEPGTSHDFLIGFNVAPGVVDGTWITNVATVTSGTTDPNATNDTSAAAGFTAIQCFLPQSDMSVTTLVSPDPVTAGESVTYTVTVINNGPHYAENVTLHGYLPDGWVVLGSELPSDNWVCDGGFTCSRINPMPPSVSETITMYVQVPAGWPTGMMENPAFVVADNPDPNVLDNWSDAVFTVNTEADLAIAKVGMPDPVVAGGMLLYQLQVENSGPSVAHDVVVTDTLPVGATFAGAGPDCSEAGGVITCRLGNLGVGVPVSEWISVYVDESLPGGTVLTNTACVADTANTVDNTPVCVSADTLVQQSALNPTDLALRKSVLATNPIGEIYSGTLGVDGYAVAGGYIDYQLVVENTGPTTATDVVVYDQLPYRFTLASTSFDPTYNPAGPFACTQEICALGSIPPGEAVTVTLHVLVESNAPLSSDSTQLFWNNAVAQAANPDLNPGDNYDSAGVTVEPLVDVTIEKTALPIPVVPGEELTYQIRVYNDGPSDLSWSWGQGQFGGYNELSVLDPLPVQVDPWTVVVEPSGYTGFCGLSQGQVSCTLDLPAGHEAILTVHGQVLSDATGPIANTAWAWDSFGTVDISATATVDVAPAADLSIDKTGPVTVTAGDVLTYTVTVHNSGPSDAQNVVVTDTLPYGVVPLSPLTLNLGAIAAGDTVTVEVVGQSDLNACYESQVTNRVEVASDTPDTDPTNNSDEWATMILNSATLEISKEVAPNPATAGNTVEFTLTVTNTGPGCASDVTVIDELAGAGNPVGLTLEGFSSGSTQGPGSPYTCSSGGACRRTEPLQAGEIDTIVLMVRIPSSTAAGMYANTAVTTWDAGSAGAQAAYTIGTAADLAVDKIDLADPVEPGQGFLYQVNVANQGASDAQELVVVDTLGDGLSFTAASPGCTGVPGGQVVTCTLDLLEAGESTWYLIAVQVGEVPSGTLLMNQVAVSSATSDPAPENNTDVEYTRVWQDLGPRVDLGLVKTATPGVVTAGDMVTYMLTVTNAGPQASNNVELLELIPVHTTLISIVADNPDSYDEFCTLAGMCYLGTVEPNSTIVTVTAVLQVDAGCPAITLTNVARVSGDEPDLNPNNNMASAAVEVTPLILTDLVLDKDATPTAEAGGPITYTLTVQNLGPQQADAVLVTDTLPAGALLAQADPACADLGGSTVVCTVGPLGDGETIVFTLVATADAALEPGASLENRAVVGPGANDPDLTNNADTADTSIIGGADLVLDETGPAEVVRSGLVTYTIVVTNSGPSVARSVDVKDELPGEIALVSAGIRRQGDEPALCSGLVCQAGDMAPGEVVVVTVVGQVEPTVAFHKVLTSTAVVFSDTPERDLDNNVDAHPVVVKQTVFDVYLPLVSKGQPSVSWPDLVASFRLSPDKAEYSPGEPVLITVIVTNQGDAAAGPFWVDFYLNPDPAPTGANQPWNSLCGIAPCYGLAWDVAGGLAAGESITLTSTPGSYRAEQTIWPGGFAAGTTDLYLYVDSWGPSSVNGAVDEINEANNRAERHGLVVPGAQSAPGDQPAHSFPPR